MNIPNTYTNVNETGCCAVPNVAEWDEKEVVLKDKHFLRMYTRSLLFMPLNMSKVMTAVHTIAEEEGVSMPSEEVMVLSRDLSPWRAEQLFAVTRPVEGADNVTLSGTYLTKVFEGPYQNAKKWYDSLLRYAESKGKTADRVYLFYTTCPTCAKHYGHNYTIGLVGASE